MTTSFQDYAGRVDLPFMIELTKNVILVGLQAQVSTPIDPQSLAFDAEGFMWGDDSVYLDILFKDRVGLARGRVYLSPSISSNLDLCFVVDAKFIEYLPSPGSS